ncbi:four-carbon acid sugar kinase family protein [Mesobacillus foraminis]|uniref:four-carbon acid sugar kinase family protein n=1 Tax=Mesobacillus foraminis TaxID=279826 RepID=UPI001BE77F3C|nr:four-carbon acid sugar kinase family protein [Mesobacillus foraminis]MBT2757414.1 four-carbon acid sugar kinase family protein [Mesobacillus foraminis]
MSEKIGIIADDLTGSNDSGVQLAKKGFASTVVMDVQKKSASGEADVLIIDTDSRAVPGEQAYEAVSKAASLLFNQGYPHVYKKVDSTLRGNIASELAALVEIYRPEAVAVAPAFPKLNRTTLNGHHYVNGKLITETEFGRDPKTPVTESFIPALLKEAAQEEIVLLNAAVLRGSLEDVIAFIEEKMAAGQKWFVCDAETESDLERIASAFAGTRKSVVWAGSGGLVEYLPEALNIQPDHKREDDKIVIDKTLIVSGSLSKVTKNQLDRLKDFREVQFVEINPVDLVNNTLDYASLILQAKENESAKQLVVYVESSDENRTAASAAGETLGMDANEVSEAIASGLGRAATAILKEETEINGLILTGGDTAKAVCSELGVCEMSLHSEVEPGLPFGQIASGNRAYWAVTKAGGFGTENSLVHAVKYMTGKVEQYESK